MDISEYKEYKFGMWVRSTRIEFIVLCETVIVIVRANYCIKRDKVGSLSFSE